jgi:hypothetical protein
MNTPPHNTSCSFLCAVLTGSCLAFLSASSLPAQTPKVDAATHAAHVAAGKHPAPDAAKGDPALNEQLSQMQAKVAQLEAALAKGAPPMTSAGAMPGMGGPPSGKGGGPPSGAGPAMAGMGQMKPRGTPGGMPGMAGGATPAPAMAGMGGGAMPPAPAAAMAGGGMAMGMDMMKMGGMMGMMDKMMGMMDKMMGMGGGAAMPPAAPMAGAPAMAMDMDDKMEMPPMGGAMPPAAPAPAMSPGMGMDKMEMAGMMGMGGMGGAAPGAMPQSALPGFPGASHLYHLGATGFFLDHTQHIALTTEQQAGLNKAKEQALLAKSTADRAKEQAEQELWMLTAADQPDAVKIEAKLAEIGKLTADERLAFIRAVGDASKLLTDAQRQSLTGFAPPAPAMPAAGMAAPAPAMAPMKDM